MVVGASAASRCVSRTRWIPIQGLGLLLGLGLMAMACQSSTEEAAAPTVAAPEDPPGTEPVGVDSLGRSIGGHLVYGLNASAGTLSPTESGCGPSCQQVLNSIADPMVGLGESGRVVPVLLAAMEAKDDFFTWELELRDGIRFHDGSDLDPGALASHLESCRASPITGAWFSPVESIEATPDRVILHLNEPWASMAEMLVTNPCNWVLAVGSEPNRPIGTGPFTVSGISSASIRLAKNLDYWRGDRGVTGEGLPLLDTVEFVVQSDERNRQELFGAALLGAYQTSDPVSQADGIETSSVGSESYELVFNLESDSPLVAVYECRRFLASVLGGERGPYVDPASPDPESNAYAFDDGCESALVEASEPLTIVTAVDTKSALLAQVAREKWNARSRGAVVATIQSVGPADLGSLAFTGRFDVLVWANSSGLSPEASFAWWHSSGARPVGQVSLNVGRFTEPEIDEALKLLRLGTIAGPAAALTIEQVMVDEALMVWLGKVEWSVASQDSVHDLTPAATPEGVDLAPIVNGVHSLASAWCDRASC